MPKTVVNLATLLTQDAANAVMLELQKLPCVNQTGVELPKRQDWVSHTCMILAEDAATKLQEAGIEAQTV